MLHKASLKINLSIFLIFSVVFLFIGEFFFRSIDYDFDHQESAWQKLPPFYRQPRVPTGEVFFRHPGPQQWTGQVIHTYLARLNIEPNRYKNEPAVTVEYDSNGFRDPSGMTDWEIVVAGDSFAELGYLPHEMQFTTVIQNILQMKVLNLGVSQTSLLSYGRLEKSHGLAVIV